MEIKFGDPYVFLFLFLIIGLIGLFIYANKLRQKKLIALTSENGNGRGKISKLLFSLFVLGLIFGIVSWTNPQWGRSLTTVKQQSTDVLIALDISKSMLAEDESPNRLTVAKRFAKELATEIRSERIGNILFAGEAYLQMPLSSDYAASQLFIGSADVDMISAQGTALGDVIILADSTFGAHNTAQKVLIIISDGEDHEPDAIRKAAELAEKNVIIYTVGVGTEDGAYVMDTSEKGVVYLKDKNGDLVQSKLNADLLKDIAKASGGGYFHINNPGRTFKIIKEHLARLEKTEKGQVDFEVSRSFYQWFLLLSILLLLLEWALRKSM